MITENMLAQSLMTAESVRMDNSCKKVLANKVILAWIMKYSMSEFADCEIAEIVSRYIEGMPVIFLGRVSGAGKVTFAENRI